MTRRKDDQGGRSRRRCPTCAGDGLVERPPDGAAEGKLPGWDRTWEVEESLAGEGQILGGEMVEVVTCPTCGGNGEVIVWLSPAEVQALRRQRRWRGLVLILAGLIPFLFLLGAVVAQPELLCGQPWYGVGLFLLLVGYSRLP